MMKWFVEFPRKWWSYELILRFRLLSSKIVVLHKIKSHWSHRVGLSMLIQYTQKSKYLNRISVGGSLVWNVFFLIGPHHCSQKILHKFFFLSLSKLHECYVFRIFCSKNLKVSQYLSNLVVKSAFGMGKMSLN